MIEIISRHSYRESVDSQSVEQIITLYLDLETSQGRLIETTDGRETNRIELSALAVSNLFDALINNGD